MNIILLLAFALPIATILLAIVLQKILKCPILVAATFFAVLLIITFAVFDSSFLVFAIIFTILAYITAWITRLICKIIRRLNLNSNCNCICNDDDDNNNGRRRRNNSNRRNCNVSSGTWRCTTRNIGENGFNQISANALSNDARVCACGNSSNSQNSNGDPVIILTNANDVINARTGNNNNNDNDNDNNNSDNCDRRRCRCNCNCCCRCNRR